MRRKFGLLFCGALVACGARTSTDDDYGQRSGIRSDWPGMAGAGAAGSTSGNGRSGASQAGASTIIGTPIPVSSGGAPPMGSGGASPVTPVMPNGGNQPTIVGTTAHSGGRGQGGSSPSIGGVGQGGSRPPRTRSSAVGGSNPSLGGTSQIGGNSSLGGSTNLPFGGSGGSVSNGGSEPIGGSSRGGNATGGRSSRGGMGGTTMGGRGPIGGHSFAGAAGVAINSVIEACTSLNPTSDCVRCQCTTCAPALLDCINDTGCVRLVECGIVSNCTTLECFTSGACSKLFLELGGISSPAAGHAVNLAICSATADCSC